MTIDLLGIDKGLVVAPAGCGKTELIASALKAHSSSKPVLILTHTNSGVAALRNRLDNANVPPKGYRLVTIDGWCMRLVGAFPERAACNAETLGRPDYDAIRGGAQKLLGGKHIDDIIAATYSRVLVDEYQDCLVSQHAIICHLSSIVPTCVVGDPMQAIFNFGNNQLADWDGAVCKHFPLAGELTTPWRWVNAQSKPLGRWLLEVRAQLLQRKPVDLSKAPAAVVWVQLDGSANDHLKMLKAGQTNAPGGNGSVLIIDKSTSPQSQQRFASQIPGAHAVEAVDLRDMVNFAKAFDIKSAAALQHAAEFAEKIMTNVGAGDLLSRVQIIARGKARRPPSASEAAAIAFNNDRTFPNLSALLVELNKEAGVRVHRPTIFRACMRAIDSCAGDPAATLLDAVVRIREQNRAAGRTLVGKSVGSTLTLKGLEADVAIILNADDHAARSLYVAMTRASKKLVICSKSPILNPNW